MKISRILMFGTFLCLLVFSSCREDVVSDDTMVIPPTTETYLNSSVSGVVNDENGNALENVIVTLGTDAISTDVNGFFSFRNKEMASSGSKIGFEKLGYFTTNKFVFPKLNDMVNVRVKMLELDNLGAYDSNTDNTITTAEDAAVILSANSVRTESGALYNGMITVYAKWLDPTSADLAETMPGDLRAMNTEDERVQLTTFGMIGVELESAAGEPLNIADGATATIELPVPASLLSSAPATIPLWHMDDASGMWVEEGEATLQGNKYVGTVTHFSFWNCDIPNDYIEISGYVTDGTNGIQSVQVMITELSTGMAGYGWTNSDGWFGGAIPNDQALTLTVSDNCGVVVFEGPIGPFSDDTDLGNIVVTVTNNIVNVSGSLECEGTTVTNGYVIVDQELGNQSLVTVEDDGTFSTSFYSCNPTEISLTGYDVDNLVASDETTYAFANTIDAGAISTCNEIEEFFTYTLDGYTATILNPTATLVNAAGENGLTIQGSGVDSSSVYLYIPMPIEGVNTLSYFEMSGVDLVIGEFFYGSCEVCSDLTFEITSLGTTGETVEGTFSGQIWGDNQQLVPTTGDFKVDIE